MFLDKIELESNEVILFQTRRHWFVLFSQLLAPLVASLIPLFFICTILFLERSTMLDLDIRMTEYVPEITFLYAAWVFILTVGAFNIWTNHYLDIITLTNRRLILVNQKGFFRRNIGSFRLERLQDLNVEIHGILATLLDYGTLTAETAGNGEEGFRSYGLPHPREIKGAVLKATDALISEYRARPLSTDGLS